MLLFLFLTNYNKAIKSQRKRTYYIEPPRKDRKSKQPMVAPIGVGAQNCVLLILGLYMRGFTPAPHQKLSFWTSRRKFLRYTQAKGKDRKTSRTWSVIGVVCVLCPDHGGIFRACFLLSPLPPTYARHSRLEGCNLRFLSACRPISQSHGLLP